VDVLAVLVNATTFATAYHLPNSAADYEAAYEAVRELRKQAALAQRDLAIAVRMLRGEQTKRRDEIDCMAERADALLAALAQVSP
jgi:hypothetical protein